MSAPHIELRRYIENSEFYTLGFFGSFGFPASIDSKHYSLCKRKLEGLFPSQKQGLLHSICNGEAATPIDNFCYFACFYDSSRQINIVDFFTPNFRRIRNRNGIECVNIDSLCVQLSKALKTDVGVRRVDFVSNNNSNEFVISQKSEYSQGKCRKIGLAGLDAHVVRIEEGYLN